MSLLNTLNRMATDLSVAFKEKFYEKKEIDQMIENIEVDTSEFVTKEDIEKIHDNKDVLDLLTTDGKDLFFNGKNVQKIELEDGQYGYSSTIMNATSNNVYTINIDKGSALCDQIVQVWGFEEGGIDLTTVAKTFNNHTDDNFFYDNNTDFTDTVCKVKDKYILDNTLNSDNIYETKLNKNDFIDLVSLTSEVDE